LSDEEKDALRKNMGSFFRAQMAKRVDKYFELPPEKRKEYLDDMIDRMQKFRDGHGPMGPHKDGDGPGPEGHGPGGPGGQGFSPDRMKEMIESTPPEERAKFEEFMKDLHERAKERGVGPGRP
jgi:hypothetical protein